MHKMYNKIVSKMIKSYRILQNALKNNIENYHNRLKVS